MKCIPYKTSDTIMQLFKYLKFVLFVSQYSVISLIKITHPNSQCGLLYYLLPKTSIARYRSGLFLIIAKVIVSKIDSFVPYLILNLIRLWSVNLQNQKFMAYKNYRHQQKHIFKTFI